MTARGSRHRVAYVAEVTPGTTPASPSMKTMRSTSCSLAVQKEVYQSAEVRADRQLVDLRHGTFRVEGDLGFELSYGSQDDFLAAALMGTWTTNVLKAGTLQQFFTVERGFTDMAQYLAFRGVTVNTMTLEIPASGIVTGSFGLLGLSAATPAGAQIAAPAAAPTTEVMDAARGSLSEGGAPLSIITAMSLNLTNNVEQVFVVGSNQAADTIDGMSILTGQCTMLFKNATLLNKFLNETVTSLSVTIADPANNRYQIDLPRVKYTTGNPPQDGGGPILLEMGFTALRDATEATNLKITRIPGP